MSKIKSWIKEHKKEIIVGVICTIITNGLHKLATLIKEIAPTAGNSLLKFISNSFYSTLADTNETTLVYSMFTAFIGFGVSFAVIILFKGFSGAKEAKNLSNEIIALSEGTSESSDSKNNSNIDDDFKNDAKKLVALSKKLKMVSISATIVFFVYFASVIGFKLLPNSMWWEYQRDLTKITPYIEQHELNVIKSDWVCMQTKEDYDAIYERINQVKEEHDLP